MTDVLFQDVVYAATGSTTKRSSKARAADIINVKDYGAVGDGATDDRAAIQAAINAAAALAPGNGATGGTVFFPAGSYMVTSSIKDPAGNAPVRLVGAGASNGNASSHIRGINVTGYTLDIPDLYPNFTRANATAYIGGVTVAWTTGTTVWSCLRGGTTAGSPPSIVGKVVGDTLTDGSVTWVMLSATLNAASNINSIENLEIFNSSTTAGDGALRIDRVAGGVFKQCRFAGFNALHCSGNVFASSFIGCAVQSSSGTNGAAGSYGIITGQMSFYDCHIVGFETGIAHYNAALLLHNCHIETNITGILLGMDPTGASNISHGPVLMGNGFERNNTAINYRNVAGGITAGNVITGVVDVVGTGFVTTGITGTTITGHAFISNGIAF